MKLLCLIPECGLARVCHVQKSIGVLGVIIDLRHQCRCWRQCVVNEYKDRLLRRQLHPLAYDVNELVKTKQHHE